MALRTSARSVCRYTGRRAEPETFLQESPVFTVRRRRIGTRRCMPDTVPSVLHVPMLDPEAVADVLQISIRHLADLRREDATFPAPRMVGSLPRWTYESIYAWVELPSRGAEAHPADALAAVSRTTPSRSKGVARVH
ncbi:conserved hypothetical protein [Aeromicrobium sp. 9AM]|nr:conserved hypothetical protein [Aeromicrobium sp. 9AM]